MPEGLSGPPRLDHAAAIVRPIEETLSEALACTSEVTPQAFPRLLQHFDADWIDEALLNTDTATLRRRRLPAEQTMWLVLGMALLRDLPITTVAQHLELVLPARDGSRTVASSALTQARARLGAAPMEWLFTRSAETWAHRSAAADRWRGLALYGVDGTTLRVADSDENRAHYGGQDTGREAEGQTERRGGYPLVRLVVVMALRSHVIAGAAFGPYGTDERSYARSLWTGLPADSLTLFDRNFLQANVLLPLQQGGTNRHWLTRVKSTTRYRSIQRLGEGDELVEFEVSSEARRRDPSLPTRFDARVVTYQRKGYPAQRLVTSLVDAHRFPAAELRALYHERWEIELGFGEIKTDLLERFETIRSKSPAAVEQELWGLLTAYNLVRLEMQRTAAELGVHPLRISFVAALRECVHQWLLAAAASPGRIPGHLATIPDRLRAFVLPPRRPERTYPRAVKIKMSNYGRKLPKPATRRRAK